MADQQDIVRTLNFADANIVDRREVRLFRDYGDRSFLVGYCRRDKWNWIKTNKLYNSRPESAKRRGGVDENDPLSYAVDYIILYKNRQRNQYRIYRVDHYEHVLQEEMADMLSQTKSVKLSALNRI